jgi:hypothetical protein
MIHRLGDEMVMEKGEVCSPSWSAGCLPDPPHKHVAHATTFFGSYKFTGNADGFKSNIARVALGINPGRLEFHE